MPEQTARETAQEVAAAVAREIEQEPYDDSIFGSDPDNLTAEVRPDGSLREVTVRFNRANCTVDVSLYGERVKACQSGKCHEVPLMDTSDAENLDGKISRARDRYAPVFDGQTIER